MRPAIDPFAVRYLKALRFAEKHQLTHGSECSGSSSCVARDLLDANDVTLCAKLQRANVAFVSIAESCKVGKTSYRPPCTDTGQPAPPRTHRPLHTTGRDGPAEHRSAYDRLPIRYVVAPKSLRAHRRRPLLPLPTALGTVIGYRVTAGVWQ